MNKSDYEVKLHVLESKIKKYEELLRNNNICLEEEDEIKNYNNYNVCLKENYFTILEKPNGEFYTKVTSNKPESYMNLSSKQFDYLGSAKTAFYTSGFYNQYNHKVIEQYIQYSFYL